MRIRFTRAVLVQGGPQFAPGDVTELSQAGLAERYVRLGWATPAPLEKDMPAAPQHRMVTNPVRKDRAGFRG